LSLKGFIGYNLHCMNSSCKHQSLDANLRMT